MLCKFTAIISCYRTNLAGSTKMNKDFDNTLHRCNVKAFFLCVPKQKFELVFHL